MSTNEQLTPAQENQRELETIMSRMPLRYEDIGACFESSLRFIRCARSAASSDNINEEDGAGIAEVLSLAEDMVQMAYLRFLLHR